MERISSRKNSVVRKAASLRTTQGRREQHRFLCEGARLCADAAESGLPVETLFYTEKAADKYPAYLQRIRAQIRGTEYLLEPSVAQLLADTRSSQEIFCVCEIPSRSQMSLDRFLESPAKGACLALEQLQDPTNLGTVLRTAEALGIRAVLLCGTGCDPFAPKVLRGSMGAVFRLQLVKMPDFAQAVPFLRRAGWRTAAAVVQKDAKPVTQVDFHRPTILAIGNEGNGLQPQTVAACDFQVTIPMLGRAESLNASASAAILMWEMMRGRGEEQ